jgi:hypothetical protein
MESSMSHVHEKPQQRKGRAKVVAGLFLAGLVLVQPAAAGDLNKLDCSLKLIPANAAFYRAMLRNREKFDAIANSRAWAKFKSTLPSRQELDNALANNPIAAIVAGQVLGFFQLPENQELIQLLADMVSHEVFIYGGETSGEPHKIPDLIIGFKLSKTETAESQLKRLESLLKDILHERFKKAKLRGSDFLTVRIDGSTIPWDENPFLGGDQFADIVKALKNLKVTISLGVSDGYLLLAIGESTSGVEKFGTGSLLVNKPELKVLERHADRKLASISYVSQASKTLLSGAFVERVGNAFLQANEMLKWTDLTNEQRERIRKDLGELAKDIDSPVSAIGPTVSCSFLTERGIEAFTYNSSESTRLDGTKPLSLLDHVGGSPLVAVVGRSRYTAERFQMVQKWLKKMPGYVDDFLVPRLEGDQKELVQRTAKIAGPLLERLGKATETMLLPALADGQGGLVLDSKIASKQWSKTMPASDQPLPLLEPALVVSVSDPALLKKASHEFRLIANDAIAKLHEAEPQKIPDFQFPEPQTGKLKNGDCYFYRLPAEWGLDEMLVPTAGLSENVAVVAVSQGHAERLLANTPLKTEGGPLADLQKPMAMVIYCHCGALVKMLGPWADYGARREAERIGDDDDAKKQAEKRHRNVIALLEALQAFRTYSSSTYLEGKITVTHSELVIRDL